MLIHTPDVHSTVLKATVQSVGMHQHPVPTRARGVYPPNHGKFSGCTKQTRRHCFKFDTKPVENFYILPLQPPNLRTFVRALLVPVLYWFTGPVKLVISLLVNPYQSVTSFFTERFSPNYRLLGKKRFIPKLEYFSKKTT